jgi:hypothetical protein
MIDYTAVVNRTIEIITNPKKTWRLIRDESARGRDMILKYDLVLALVPTACGFLGHLAWGSGFFFALINSALMLGVYLGSLFGMGLVINGMAPSFGTVRNENAAYKLVVYASTPVWVAGALTLFPSLGLLALVVGFGTAAYLFYLGCQVLMETPKEKALPFTGAAMGLWLIGVVVVGLVVSEIAASMFSSGMVIAPVAPTPMAPTPLKP